MLRQKIIKSLQMLCIESVYELLIDLNQRDISSDFPWLNQGKNPFICLPNVVIEEVFSYLNQEEYLSVAIKKEILQILLCPHLDQVNLQCLINEKDLPDILDMIISIAPHLKTLIIDFKVNPYSGIPFSNFKPTPNTPDVESKLKKIFQLATSLTHLTLNHVCNDHILSIVGKYCSNLITLYVKTNQITDTGLKNLSISKDSEPHSQCQKLQEIHLSPFSDISHEGVKALLVNLPNITAIRGAPNFPNVLLMLHNDNYKSCGKTYRLKELKIDRLWHQGNSTVLANIIVNTCPHISSLIVDLGSNDDLMILSNLKSLRSVTINVTSNKLSDLRINFDDGLLPFIQKVGSNLKDLSLANIDKIDFYSVGYFCHELKTLLCIYIEEMFASHPITFPIFKNLRTLKTVSSSRMELPPSLCVMLLSNCKNLVDVHINCCRYLTDHHLEEILRLNPLENLLHLSLSFDRCTEFGLELLIHEGNKLENLTLIDTVINEGSLARIKESMKKKNLDLKLTVIRRKI